MPRIRRLRDQVYEQALGIREGGCLDWREWPDPNVNEYIEWLANSEDEDVMRRARLSAYRNFQEFTRTDPHWKRALNLLRQHLTPEQWLTLGEHGYFVVTGRIRRYGRWTTHRFTIHNHCTVYEHEPNGRRHYCLVALEPGLPDFDWMLMVKLLIESNLRKFYDIAKRRGFQPLERYDAQRLG